MLDLQSLTSNNSRQWFVFTDDKHFGPYAENYLVTLFKRGAVGKNAYLWSAGQTEWQPIQSVSDFYIYHDFLSETSSIEILDPVPQRSKIGQVEYSLDSNLGFAEALKAARDRDAQDVKKKKAKHYLLAGLALATIVTIATVLLSIEPNWKAQVRRQGGDEATIAQLQKAMSATGETKIAFSTSKDDPKAPVLFVASNLSDERRLTLKISGQPETLVGRLWIAFETDIALQSGLGWTMPIRGQDGTNLPSGKYNVEIACANCSVDEKAALTKSTFQIGKEDAQYASELTLFHEKLKQKAADEVVELDEIANTLDDQISEFKLFLERRASITKPKARAAQWAVFRDDWGQMQSQFEKFFSVFEPKNMKSEFVLSKVYTRLRAVNALLVQALNEAAVAATSGASKKGETERLLGLAQSLNAATRSRMIEIHRRVESNQKFPLAQDLD